MTMNEQTLQKAFMSSDLTAIRSILSTAINEKQKLDRWFDKYLLLLDYRMDENDFDNPVRNLYRKKYRRYEQVSRIEALANFYLGKLS